LERSAKKKNAHRAKHGGEDYDSEEDEQLAEKERAARHLRMAERMHPGFVVVKTLHPGESFGELALKYDRDRLATVVCKGETRLATLHRDIYRQTIDAVIADDVDEKKDFMMRVALFEGLPFEVFSGIVYEMQKKSFHCGEVVYSEGAPAENIYFVKSGEIELQRQQP
jgi:CRP-like cAMP-binding protein